MNKCHFKVVGKTKDGRRAMVRCVYCRRVSSANLERAKIGVFPAAVCAFQNIRGFGDMIKWITKLLKIRQCGGCKKRQHWINRVINFALIGRLSLQAVKACIAAAGLFCRYLHRAKQR